MTKSTAALERGAALRLFERIRQLREAGVAIMYISHHLEEVFEICTDVAVLRDGELVLTAPMPEVGKEDLVTAMVGDKKKDHDPERAPVTPPPPGLASRGSRGAGRTRAPDLVVSSVAVASTGVFLSGVSLTVRGGERVGVTGLRGSGATTLARIVAGAAAPDAGEVRLCYPELCYPGRGDRVLRPGDRAGALPAGIGYIPEDRQAEGFVPLLSAAENIAMTITDRISRVASSARGAARIAPRRWPDGSRWCRPGSASRSGSCPAATSRR